MTPSFRLASMARRTPLATLLALVGCTALECTLLPCFDGLRINLDRSPDTGTMIEVTSSGGARTTSSEFDLDYVTSEPNGPGCGTCTGAEISVFVP